MTDMCLIKKLTFMGVHLKKYHFRGIMGLEFKNVLFKTQPIPTKPNSEMEPNKISRFSLKRQA